MQWYVLQTRTGEEEKLVDMIRKIVPKKLYGECFVVYHEQLWRRQKQNFVQIKRTFPGYVFITCQEPEALFFCLKQLPVMAKIMADDTCFFLALEAEEAAFLGQIMDERHIIVLSYLETDSEGKILQVAGPLKSCVPQIVCCKFGKRYVLVRIKLLGREKEVLLGIMGNEDICQTLRYGRIEAPIQVPEKYTLSDEVRPIPKGFAFTSAWKGIPCRTKSGPSRRDCVHECPEGYTLPGTRELVSLSGQGKTSSDKVYQ